MLIHHVPFSGLWVARELGSAAAIVEAGAAGLSQRARQAGPRVQRSTLEKIVAWPVRPLGRGTGVAPSPDLPRARCRPAREGPRHPGDRGRTGRAFGPDALCPPLEHRRDQRRLGRRTRRRDGADRALPQGPSDRGPGRVVPLAVSERSGRPPRRALVRHANRDLRHAILTIADNLIKCNEHFAILAAGWRLKGKDARDLRVRVAGRFCRIAYQMVAGRMTFRHPCTGSGMTSSTS